MRKRKELMASAPWRGEEEPSETFANAKLKATRDSSGVATMHVPGKKEAAAGSDQDLGPVIDPELRYTFQRNFQFLQKVFTMETVLKPLPPGVSYVVSRNLNFFARIFTQFWDPEGIANAQKSLGLEQEERARRVN